MVTETSITKSRSAVSRTAGRPGVLGPRIIASTSYVTQRGRGRRRVTEEQVAAMITHQVAARQCRLSPQQSAVVWMCPARLAGREQVRKLLIVEGYPILSPDQSQTVIILPSACSPGGSRSRRDECLITAF
jgi:hypothetical protein